MDAATGARLAVECEQGHADARQGKCDIRAHPAQEGGGQQLVAEALDEAA